MKIINTEKMKIKEIIKGSTMMLTNSILISSLLFNYVKADVDVSEEDICYTEKYEALYEEQFSNISDEEIDEEFTKIYENENIIIDDEEIKLNNLYIKKLKDGSVFITNDLYLMKNLLTNEVIIGVDWTDICLFKESSVFYNLYQDNLLKNNESISQEDILNYIKDWDGEKHYKTKDLIAQKEVEEILEGDKLVWTMKR